MLCVFIALGRLFQAPQKFMPAKLYDLKVPICFPNAVTKFFLQNKLYNAFTKLQEKHYNKKSNNLKNQDLIMKKSKDTEIIVYSKIPFSKNLYHMETSQLICKANQMTDFYMMSFC